MDELPRLWTEEEIFVSFGTYEIIIIIINIIIIIIMITKE